MEKVLVAMSGGVDSSVAALLLQEQGYECIGASMLLTGEAHQGKTLAFDAAARLCQQIGMEHHLLDLRAAFDREVVQPFVEAYEAGLTPNPCVICNRRIKFGLLLEEAQKLGCHKIATGHYCRLANRGGRRTLVKAADGSKDQTYFLYSLSQETLAHLLFPLGGLHKDQVRQIARDHHLEAASSPDSQDICFVDDDYLSFLEQYRGRIYPPAELVNEEGQVLGTGKSALAYTPGQRRGLGLAMTKPSYVLRTDVKKNQVLVGPREKLYKRSLHVSQWNWMGFSGDKGLKAGVKVRYNAKEMAAWIQPDERAGGGDSTTEVTITFDQPVRAIAPGQSAVAYLDDVLVGGGIISGN